MYFIKSPEWDFMSIVEVDAMGAFVINSMAEASGSIERPLMYEVFTAGAREPDASTQSDPSPAKAAILGG